MTARVLVNGVADDRVSALDRGLAYGDGLFETIRWTAGRAPLWDRHLARLAAGCRRLGIPAPDSATLADEAARVIGTERSAIVKLIVTRGAAQRGYASAPRASATRIVAAFPLPALPRAWYAEGICVRTCALRLAAQPALAGIKHLNRLEQVLARAEWSDPAIVEGLLFDSAGHLVSATAANVFVVVDGRVRTPPVDACGVAGVLRGALLDGIAGITVAPVTKDDLRRADEVFLSSSVRGVLPVRDVDGRAHAIGPRTREAQARWRALGLPEAGA